VELKGGALCEFVGAKRRQGEHREPGLRKISVRKFICRQFSPSAQTERSGVCGENLYFWIASLFRLPSQIFSKFVWALLHSSQRREERDRFAKRSRRRTIGEANRLCERSEAIQKVY